jgi:hypothetical protein
MIDLKIIIIWIVLGASAVFAFTGNMFLGEYTRVFVAIGCVAAGVLLYTTEQSSNYVLPESETIDSRNLRNQLAAAETKTSPQPTPTPDLKKELERIDEKFAELHKAEHIQDATEKPVMEHLKEVVEEATRKPVPLTELQNAKNKQAEFRKAKKLKDEDPFKTFKV